jgi:hypothetical protein
LVEGDERRVRLRLFSCVGVVVLGLAPRLASADGRDPTGAEALFLAGRDAVERKDYATACPKFAESDRLDPAAGTLINLADCEEHIDRPAAAWGHWKAAIDLLEPSDPRLPTCKERAAAVEKRVTRLVLKLRPGSPAGTRVMRDGSEIGPAALGIAIPQEPGEHALLVTAPGHKTRETSLVLAEGEVKELVLDTGELEAVPAPIVTPPVVPEAPPSSTAKTLGVVLVGAGLAGLAVGTTTGIMALSKNSDVEDNCFPVGVCNERGHDAASSGRTLAIVSTIGFSAGATLLGVGAVLFLTAPKTPTAASTPAMPRTTAAPLFLPGGIGFAFTREL